MPKLSCLSIDLGPSATISIRALVALLRKNTALSSLHLSGINFEGSPEEMQLLRALLEQSGQLKTVKLHCCRGTWAVTEMISSPHMLKHIELDCTSLISDKNEASLILAKLVRSPHLKSLSLINVPNICDEHIKALSMELSCGSTQLKELNITSSVLGSASGDLVTKMLYSNDTIDRLILHIDFDKIGYYMAQALQTNSTLQSIDLRVDGDEDVSGNCVALARALRGTDALDGQNAVSALQHLRLCMEISPAQLSSEVITEFEKTLQTNRTLSKLSFDDTIERYQLPSKMSMKLALNQSLVCKLIRNDSADASRYNRLVEAVISERNKLNVVFFALSEAPMLCETASRSLNGYDQNNVNPKKKCDDNDQECRRRYYKLPSRTSTVPRLTRRVISFFAPSA